MTNKEFVAAQKQLGLNTQSLAQLLGYRRIATIYEMRSGNRLVPELVGSFLRLILALGEVDRNIVIGYILSGKKGKLNLTHQ